MVKFEMDESIAREVGRILIAGMTKVPQVSVGFVKFFFAIVECAPDEETTITAKATVTELPPSKKLTKKEAQRADVNAYQRKYAQDRRKFQALKAAGKIPKKMTIGQYRASL